MTQSPFDQLSKQYLEDFLSPIGIVERQYEVPGESKYVDVWFKPNLPITESIEDLGLLKEMAKSPAVIEAYSNPPNRDEMDACLLKRLWIKEDERRQRGDSPYPEDEQPMLWILASHLSKPLRKAFSMRKTRPSGVYTLGPGFRTRLVAIDELPKTKKTLWIRVLGRDETQLNAIQEVVALPEDHPRRTRILRLLMAWKVRIEMGEVQEFLGQEAVMAYPQVFLDWEKATEERGITIGEERQTHALVLRLLNRRCGELSQTLKSRLTGLSIGELEQLSEALLEFRNLDDLEVWLNKTQA